MTNKPVVVLDGVSDEVMIDNAQEFADAIVGRSIKNVDNSGAFKIELSDGTVVVLSNSDDCCAFTELEGFLLSDDYGDHIITNVEIDEVNYSMSWHVLAEDKRILDLDVAYSEGSGYYHYGFWIDVSKGNE